MTENRRIFLNIVATYGRSLYALIIVLFCGRWTLMALGEVDYGLMGVVGGLTAFMAYFNGILGGAIGRFYALSVGEQKKDPAAGLEARRRFGPSPMRLVLECGPCRRRTTTPRAFGVSRRLACARPRA